MTQEEKDLLYKDLCARLPYGVKIQILSWDDLNMEYINKVDVLYSINSDNYIKTLTEDYDYYIEDIKPYLFPLSSITEQQRKEYHELMLYNPINGLSIDFYDWCNKNHLDGRGLIKQGLAIDASNLNIY